MSQKYPKTLHLPWSPGVSNDDKRMMDVSSFLNVPLLITEKMDGSNVCLEHNIVYARSHNQVPKHPSFDMLKGMHAEFRHLIPENFQIFGEWLYAKHSIKYFDLPSYLMIFGIRDIITGEWSDWQQVEEMATDLRVATVPVLERGLIIKSSKQLREITTQLAEHSSHYGCREGIVVRRKYRFEDEYFPKFVGKWVRKDHVQTDEHWSHSEIIINSLKK